MIRYLAIIGTLTAFAGAPAIAQQSTAPGQTTQDKDSAKGAKGVSANAPAEMQDKGTAKGTKPGLGVTTGSGSGAGSRHTGNDSSR
jgi:hypothetical protein